MPPESPGFAYLYDADEDVETVRDELDDHEARRTLFSSRVRVQGRHQNYDALSFRRLRPEFVRSLAQKNTKPSVPTEAAVANATNTGTTSKVKARLEMDLYLAQKQKSWGFAGPGEGVALIDAINEVGLSADSFTKFARVGGSTSSQLELRLHRSTAKLLSKCTGNFARAWCAGLLERVQNIMSTTKTSASADRTHFLNQWPQFTHPLTDLCAGMHKHGLNLRHLGLVLKAVDKHLARLRDQHQWNQVERSKTFSRQVKGLAPELEVPTLEETGVGGMGVVETVKEKRARQQLLWEENSRKVLEANAKRQAQIAEWRAKNTAAAELEQDVEAAAIHARWWIALEICCRALKHVWKASMRNACAWQQQVNLKELCTQSAEFLNEKAFQPSSADHVFWQYPGGTLDYHIRLRFGSNFCLLPEHLKSNSSLYDYIKHPTRPSPILSPQRLTRQRQRNALQSRDSSSSRQPKRKQLGTQQRRSRHEIFLEKVQGMTGIKVEKPGRDAYVLPSDISLQPITTTPSLLDYSMGLRMLHDAERLLRSALTTIAQRSHLLTPSI